MCNQNILNTANVLQMIKTHLYNTANILIKTQCPKVTPKFLTVRRTEHEMRPKFSISVEMKLSGAQIRTFVLMLVFKDRCLASILFFITWMQS